MNFKRTFDLLVAGLGLIILAPFLAVIAIMIALDSPGPILFSQDRVGRGGAVFRIFKFRSMTASTDTDGLQITVGADSRITKLGSLLRKWKLDELPQLWNVTVGEMSIVGPRPEVPKYVAHYPAKIRERILSVRPGLTDPCSLGLSNESKILATARDPHKYYVEILLPEKIKIYDQYVKNQSFFLDLKIIIFTVSFIILQKSQGFETD